MVIHDLDGAFGVPHETETSIFWSCSINPPAEAYRSAVIHESKVGGHGCLSRPQMTCENQRLPKDEPLLSPPSAFLLGKK